MSHPKISYICTTPATALSLWQVAKRALHCTTAEYNRMFYLPQPTILMVFCETRRHFKWLNACTSYWQLVWSNTRSFCVALTCPRSGSLSAVIVPVAVYVGTDPQHDAVGRYIFLHSQVYCVRALSINCQNYQPSDSINRQRHLTYIVES